MQVATIENNHIRIPGFYDDVLESSADDRKKMAAAPFDEKDYMKDLGVKALWGEKGFTTNERTGIRPTLELNGIWGGYQGEGSKTVSSFKSLGEDIRTTRTRSDFRKNNETSA